MDDDEYNFVADEDNADAPDRGVDESERVEGNIRDLEFRLTNDLSRLERQSDASRSLTLKEMTMLKVIICSGLLSTARNIRRT